MSNLLSTRFTLPAATRAVAALVCCIVSTSCVTAASREKEDALDDARDEAAISAPERSSPSDFQPIAPCLLKSDYEMRGVVTFGWSRESKYTPPCAALASGGGATVVFQGSLDEHPLEPRPLGTSPSPIVATSAGGGVEFEFPDFGFFPYRCAKHPEEIGVIWAGTGSL